MTRYVVLQRMTALLCCCFVRECFLIEALDFGYCNQWKKPFIDTLESIAYFSMAWPLISAPGMSANGISVEGAAAARRQSSSMKQAADSRPNITITFDNGNNNLRLQERSIHLHQSLTRSWGERCQDWRIVTSARKESAYAEAICEIGPRK